MSINDLRITDSEIASKRITSLSDTPSKSGMSAADLKAMFDALPLWVRDRYNALLDELFSLGVESLIQSGDIGYVRLNADGMLEVSADGNVWTLAASGGHIIVDKEGNLFTQRSRLKFVGDTAVSDDGTQTIISGLKGDQGEQGIQGVKGEKGDKGDKGERGVVFVPNVAANGVLSWEIQDAANVPQAVNIRGPQGVAGTQGAQGPIGPKGAQGIQGVQGIQGIQGKKGDQGEKGERGLTGAQGPIGPQGVQGVPGSDGKSFVIQDIYPTIGELKAALPTGNEYAYQVSSDKNIYIWSERENAWISLGPLQGPQGPQGIQGIQGEQGIPGVQGEKGDQGAQGPQGEQGVQGEQGAQGIQGVPGNDGKSAFATAAENGYTGTETAFNQSLVQVPTHISNTAIHVTASDKTAWNAKAEVSYVDNGLADKVDKIDGKGLSTNDYTTAEKTKLAGIAAGANKTVVDSSLSATGTNPVQGKAVYSAINTKAARASYTATLSTNWTGTSAPYTQEVTISGILATDNPHITPVYSSTNAAAILEKKAWNMVGKAVTSAGKITFTCFEEKPEQTLSLQIEIIR